MKHWNIAEYLEILLIKVNAERFNPNPFSIFFRFWYISGKIVSSVEKLLKSFLNNDDVMVWTIFIGLDYQRNVVFK